jgi:hypothetical protein
MVASQCTVQDWTLKNITTSWFEEVEVVKSEYFTRHDSGDHLTPTTAPVQEESGLSHLGWVHVDLRHDPPWQRGCQSHCDLVLTVSRNTLDRNHCSWGWISRSEDYNILLSATPLISIWAAAPPISACTVIKLINILLHKAIRSPSPTWTRKELYGCSLFETKTEHHTKKSILLKIVKVTWLSLVRIFFERGDGKIIFSRKKACILALFIITRYGKKVSKSVVSSVRPAG